jgi:hypothetical protein
LVLLDDAAAFPVALDYAERRKGLRGMFSVDQHPSLATGNITNEMQLILGGSVLQNNSSKRADRHLCWPV